MQEVNCLRDTMHILAQGYYIKDGKKVPLQLSRDEREKARVFLPPEVHALESYKPDQRIFTIGRCGYSCENIDTFMLQIKPDLQSYYMKHKSKCS